jgi:hypothetical protein
MQTAHILVVAVLAVVLAVPAVLLAKALKAQRPRYGYVFTATLFTLIIAGVTQLVSANQQLRYSVVLLSGSLLYGFALRLRLLKSFVIALIVSILHFAITAVVVSQIANL